MKKSILSLTAAVGLLVGANAQSNNTTYTHVVRTQKVTNGDYVSPSNTVASKPTHFLNEGSRTESSKLLGTRLATTTYDLQTNSSNPNRMQVHSDGTMAATWTGSQKTDQAYTDRGAFYLYNDGTSWSGDTTTRIETQRTGWPAHGFTRNGEIVLSHDPATGFYNLVQNVRSAKGTGTWSETALSDFTGIWPRVATSGDTVHAIYCNYTGNDNDDSRTLYARSTDGGATWDKKNVLLPGLDDYDRMSADIYSIRAKDSMVYIVTGASHNNLEFFKSTDAGETFTRTTILDINIDGYEYFDATAMMDTNNDQIPDTILTHDASPDILIDTNGVAHVWVGSMAIFDDGSAAGYNYFQYLNMGLYYWNENMGADSITIVADAKIIDLNGDGDYFDSENGMQIGNGNANYGNAMISMPTAGLDPNTGNIYVAYTAPSELMGLDIDLSEQLPYREIYGYVGSLDSNGNYEWSTPVNLTNSARIEFENVYPQIGDLVNGKVHMLWQRDDYPGVAVGENAVDVIKFNEVLYHAFDTTAFMPVAPTAAASSKELSCKATKFEAVVTSGDVREFKWEFGDGLISYERNPSHVYTAQGTYEVKLTVSNPWGSSSTTISVAKPCVGIEEITVEEGLTVYPNPTEGTVNINFTTSEQSTVSVNVFNTLGALVSTKEAGSFYGTSEVAIDLNDEPNGLYIVKINVGNEVITRSVTLSK